MIKERFDIKNYKGAYVMNCDTKEKADVFIKYLNSVDDNLWRVNLCIPDITFWWVNGEKTCYDFNKGTFGTTRQFEEKNYKTLEFDDFYWGEEGEDMNDNMKLHDDILMEIHDTYVKKNSDYGDSFSKGWKKYGMVSAICRMSDKWERIESLYFKDLEGDEVYVDESMEDTMLDLANYLIMSVMELRKGKERE